MKIPRARFEMATMIKETGFDPEVALELFSKIPFVTIPEYGKTTPCVEIPKKSGEKVEDKKRKQKKRKILTGVSRQRRAANDRERRRNVRLNQAFVSLKKTLPLSNIDISKIEILRLAVKWIDHLATLLKDYDEHKDLLTLRQLQTSSPNENEEMIGKPKPVRHDCLYHQDPDLKNTLWEDCIGLPNCSTCMTYNAEKPIGFCTTTNEPTSHVAQCMN